jgi:hypothetical protein
MSPRTLLIIIAATCFAAGWWLGKRQIKAGAQP